jgi:N-dimethylarginine dimethylaminohydrolase
VRDGAGELLEVKAETVVISEGYARTAAEAAYDMRACLCRQIEKAGQHPS